jgi:hypothetical protein
MKKKKTKKMSNMNATELNILTKWTTAIGHVFGFNTSRIGRLISDWSVENMNLDPKQDVVDLSILLPELFFKRYNVKLTFNLKYSGTCLIQHTKGPAKCVGFYFS